MLNDTRNASMHFKRENGPVLLTLTRGFYLPKSGYKIGLNPPTFKF